MVKMRIEYKGEIRELECQYIFGSGCVSETETEINAATFLYGHISIKDLANLMGAAVTSIVNNNAEDPITGYIALKAIADRIEEAKLEMMQQEDKE